MSARWCVAETRPSGEQVAQYHLERAGFESFVPSCLVDRVVHGRLIEFQRPLFPRYVFIAIDFERPRWRVVYSTIGVKRVLGPPGGLPQPLRPGIGESLREMEPLRPVAEAVARLLVGARVCLIHGPLTGQTAKLAKIERERCILLMSLLGSEVEVKVPTKWVSALTADQIVANDA